MASPHIAGLLAYLLSLQPAKDSAYAVADITPKQLKANLISIATEGALSDVPSNTKNILAWNGGGSSNYTDIVDKGGYAVSKGEEEEDSVTITIPNLSELEMEFEESLEAAGRKVQKGSSSLQEKVEKLSREFEDFVADEMEEFFDEFRARMEAAKAE